MCRVEFIGCINVFLAIKILALMMIGGFVQVNQVGDNFVYEFFHAEKSK